MYTRPKERGRERNSRNEDKVDMFVRACVRPIVQSNHPSISGCCSGVRVGCVHHVSR